MGGMTRIAFRATAPSGESVISAYSQGLTHGQNFRPRPRARKTE